MRATTSLPVLALTATAAAANCNGNAAYCNTAYSQLTFTGSHNSAFVGIGPSDNQLSSVTAQLNQGIRFMTTQTHDNNGVIHMCHTSCALLDAGPLQDYLGTVKTWLDANPNEVVTLLITNGDGLDINRFGAAFEAVGLDSYAFVPSGTLALADWPTLGTMISAGQRVVVLMDYYADTTKVPYILDEFTYYFETPFDPQEAQLSVCNVDRPAGASSTGRMILANHNRNYEVLGISLPDLAHASDTNSVASITAQTNTCKSLYGRNPNVVLLDYVVLGDVIDAQSQLNGV